MKKIFLIQVKIKGCKEFFRQNFPEGVIGTLEIGVDTKKGTKEEIDNYLLFQQEDFLRELVDVTMEEMKDPT